MPASPESYVIASGEVLAGGRFSLPAWARAAPLNAWVTIPNTSGAGGAAIDAFSGFAVKEDTSELFCLACGGHLDSSDNRVTSIDLRSESPAWGVRCAASDAVDRVIDVSHYNDGKPASRHTYRHNFWMPQLNRLMTVGARAVYGNANFYYNVDGFNPSENTWDPAGTWPVVPSAGGFGACKDGEGNIFTSGFRKLSPLGAWQTITVLGAATAAWRSPVAYTSALNGLFCLQYGDGFGSETGVNASFFDVETNTRYDITLSGGGLAQFITDARAYGGMDYEPKSGRFLWYAGQGAAAGRMYWITPGVDFDSWGIEIAEFATESAVLPATPSGGMNGKFAYLPRMKWFVLMPSSAAGLYFLRCE